MSERPAKILPRLVPAHLAFVCNGMVYRWRDGPTKAFPCGQIASTQTFNKGPDGWELHPEYGWLCPSCSETKGEPRQLATQ